MTILPPEDQPPQREALPDNLLKIVLMTVSITVGLSVVAIWVATHTS